MTGNIIVGYSEWGLIYCNNPSKSNNVSWALFALAIVRETEINVLATISFHQS